MRFPQLPAVADMADWEFGHGDERHRTAGLQASSLARERVPAGSIRALPTRASTGAPRGRRNVPSVEPQHPTDPAPSGGVRTRRYRVVVNSSGVRASRHLASRLTYITSIFEGTGPSSSDDQIRAIAYKHPAFEVLHVDQLPPADHHDHAVQPRSKPGPERGAGRPVLKPLIDHRAICGK
jgi:hypothetical protein